MYLENYEIQKLVGTVEEFITEKTCSALGILLNEPIFHKISIQENKKSHKTDVSFSSNEIKLCSVRLNGKGDLHIELLYTIKIEHALNIASKLLGSKIERLDEMGMSALQEVANILTGSFFNALSEYTGYRIDLSTPSFKEGKLDDLIKEPTKDVDSCPDDVVITDISLWGENTKTEIHMIMIQHPDHAKKLISSNNRIPNIEEYESKSNTNLLGGRTDSIDKLMEDHI